MNAWIQHWVALGFQTLEEMVILYNSGASYCFGNSITIADICLVPQFFNAKRFKCDLTLYPNLSRIVEALETIPAFVKASPGKQADAE